MSNGTVYAESVSQHRTFLVVEHGLKMVTLSVHDTRFREPTWEHMISPAEARLLSQDLMLRANEIESAT